MKLVYGIVVFTVSMFLLTVAYFFAVPIQKVMYSEINETVQGMDIASSVKADVSKTLNFQIFLLRVTAFLFTVAFIGWLWAYSQKEDYQSVRY